MGVACAHTASAPISHSDRIVASDLAPWRDLVTIGIDPGEFYHLHGL